MNDVRHPAAPLLCHTQRAIQGLFNQEVSSIPIVCQVCAPLQMQYPQANRRKLDLACLLHSQRSWDLAHASLLWAQQTHRRVRGLRPSVHKTVMSCETFYQATTSGVAKYSMSRLLHQTQKIRGPRPSFVSSAEDRALEGCRRSASAMGLSSVLLTSSFAKTIQSRGSLWRSSSKSYAVAH